MPSGVEPIHEVEHGFASDVRMSHQVDKRAIDAQFGVGDIRMQVVIARRIGHPYERAIIVLPAEGDAATPVGLQVGHIDEVVRFNIGDRHVVRQDILRLRAPVKSDGGGPGSHTTEFPRAVQVMHVRKLAVTEFIVLIGEKGRCIANRYIALFDTRVVHELGEKGNHHLRRRVHVIELVNQLVCVGVHPSPGPADKSYEVDFDHDLFAGPVTCTSLPVALVEVTEESIPRAGHRILAGQCTDSVGHHFAHDRLVGMVLLPPMSVAGARPLGCIRVVHPYHAPAVDSLARPDRSKRYGVQTSNEFKFPEGPIRGHVGK